MAGGVGFPDGKLQSAKFLVIRLRTIRVSAFRGAWCMIPGSRELASSPSPCSQL